MVSAARSCATHTSSVLDATDRFHFVTQLLAVLGKADDLCLAKAGTCQASDVSAAHAGPAAGGETLWMNLCVSSSCFVC